jgi:outer membrane immunogenic protein
MKRIALLALSIVLFAPAMAHAKAEPAYNWSGFYAGVNGGLGTTNSTSDIGLVSGTLIPGNQVPSSVDLNSAGIIVGGQAGYNWNVMPLTVVGVETDFDYTNINSNNQAGGPTDPSRIIRTAQNLEFFGTVRARAGYEVMPKLLVFGTGGLAYGMGRMETDLSRTGGCGGNNCQSGSKEEMLMGWTVGAGAEYALTNKVSIKAEYLHYDIGSIDFNMTDPNFPGNEFTSKTNFDGDIVRIGVNYSFTGI